METDWRFMGLYSVSYSTWKVHNDVFVGLPPRQSLKQMLFQHRETFS